MARDDDEALAQEREWQAIVDNYGERAVLEPEEGTSTEDAPGDGTGAQSAVASAPEGSSTGTDDQRPAADAEPDEEAFVPPRPPPLPRPPTDRFAAWLGVFGVPAVVLVCVVFGISLPTWAGLMLAAGFVGGFLYLVFRLPGTPRDPWDDGAVL